MSEYITIPLSKTGKNAGKYEAIVALEDADLATLNWSVLTGGGYAHRAINNSSVQYTILMHRVVLERMLGRPLVKGEMVDHINGKKLDNRRENLRLATSSQNQANRSKATHNNSGYKGVYWAKRQRKWAASIRSNRKHIHIGYFDNPEDAHKAYCQKAKEIHGEFWNAG